MDQGQFGVDWVSILVDLKVCQCRFRERFGLIWKLDKKRFGSICNQSESIGEKVWFALEVDQGRFGSIWNRSGSIGSIGVRFEG